MKEGLMQVPEVKQQIVDAMIKQWQKDTPQLQEDIQNLITQVVGFNVKYGARLTINFDSAPSPKDEVLKKNL